MRKWPARPKPLPGTSNRRSFWAARTKATPTKGGFLVNGTKVWTTGANHADYMIGLFRTSPPAKENRRHGLTQFLVDMQTPGIRVNPISDMNGTRHFNELGLREGDDFIERRVLQHPSALTERYGARYRGCRDDNERGRTFNVHDVSS